ncbi:MAG TPA: tetratricopeptide repeat protein [Streptosporangiaceae bacterium]|nr:tetratricopeptide repeat protein [Streptosporangiaceae bacterium]
MDAGLLWTAVGSAAAVPALVVGAWQLRLQMLEHNERRRAGEVGPPPPSVPGALSVAPPVGRLPADVRGRGPLLAELRQALTHRRPRANVWVLTGMGGLGKTTVALAVAETAMARGFRVWWVTATDAASLAGGMLEILAQLGAPESVTQLVQEGAPTAPDRAWEHITGSRATGKRWLLIFDDADNPAVLAAPGKDSPADGTGWLRPGLPGMVIVTTRRREPRTWGHKVQLRELDPLDDEVAADVLADLAPLIQGDARKPAKDLGHRLGGLPLALHLAGTYLSSPFARWHSFADYLQALDSDGLASALANLEDPSAQARLTVTRTWELSLDALTADGRPQTRALLFLLSCYAPLTPIPTSLLQPHLLTDLLGPDDNPGNPETDQQRRLLDAGLYGLSVVGLINATGKPGSAHDRAVTIHPVVADVNRNRLLTTARHDLPVISTAAIGLLRAACEALDTRSPADWPVWRRLIPHTTALLGWLGPHLDDAPLADMVALAAFSARALWRSGNPAAAERLAQASLNRAADRLGPDHPATLVARSQLAQVVALTRYAEAEHMLRQLLIDQQRILGEEHPDTMTSQRVLARLTGLQGRYVEAEHMYRGLLADRQRLLGDEHPETLATRHGLAGMVERVGNHAEAEQMFRDLLGDQQRILGEDHQECLEIRSGLVRTIEDQHRYQEAEQLYQQLLADDQRVLGLDHPGTLNTRQSLARIAAAQGRLDEAKQLYQQLLADRQRILGDDHPVTRATREFLASSIESTDLAGHPGMAPVETLLSLPSHPLPRS